MSSSNKFLQGTKVPEPGTILGLLTVGGLGLVSRFKKQK
ncbi:MAG: PEP-CTERM sorting domain-containing protein [Microcystis aeruginosa LG13-12]|nr:PEP-CTERM sorting domain-containing protein [Microcystis aeruginosa LG13-12]